VNLTCTSSADFEPDPNDFVPDGLEPDADKGAEAHNGTGNDDPGDNAPDANNDAHDQRSVDPDANEYQSVQSQET